MNSKAGPMAQSMAKIISIPFGRNVVSGNPVHLFAGDPWLHSGLGHSLGLFNRHIDILKLLVGHPQDNGEEVSEQ